MKIYLAGNWMSTGPRANDDYFLVDSVHLSEEDALSALSACGEVFAAKPGDPFIDWEHVSRDEQICPSPEGSES